MPPIEANDKCGTLTWDSLADSQHRQTVQEESAAGENAILKRGVSNIETDYKSSLGMRFSCSTVSPFEAAMLEHVRSFGLCRPKKKDHALAVLLFCALLCAPSPSFASSGAADGIMPVNPKAVLLEIGRRGGSLTSHGDGKTLTTPSGDVTDDAKSLRHTVEGPPGRFPYLCSLRMAGIRKHECTPTPTPTPTPETTPTPSPVEETPSPVTEPTPPPPPPLSQNELYNVR